jgi:heme oxygenase
MTTCPAFEAGSCPFRDAKSADDVRHALLLVPPSHLQEKGHFYKALRHLHHVNQTVDHIQPKFEVAGGCPVQTYSPHSSFSTAMEEWSLASIMARMAQDLEDQDSPDNQQQIAEETSAPTRSVTHVSATEFSSHQQVSLSQALKTGTAASHQAAENVHFVRNFIKGKIDRKLYGELVLSLYHVYTSLEEALDQHAPQHFAPCHFPKELCRKEALEEDVDFWHGGLPERVSCATRDYQERIQHISEKEPLLLLAHAYTRYLGDLSGGKILARVARKAMDLGKDGLEFYEFQHVKSAKLFKDQYRSALDELPLTPAQVSKLVAEANVAFVLNMRIFEELDVMANIPGATVRDLQEALDFANSTSTGEGSNKECPFAKMSGGVNPHAIVGTKRQFPWSVIIGLVCAVAWSFWQNCA